VKDEHERWAKDSTTGTLTQMSFGLAGMTISSPDPRPARVRLIRRPSLVRQDSPITIPRQNNSISSSTAFIMK